MQQQYKIYKPPTPPPNNNNNNNITERKKKEESLDQAGVACDFSPRINFQCRLSDSIHTPSCAINVCAHVRDPVVHVRVWWIMETRKHPTCNAG